MKSRFSRSKIVLSLLLISSITFFAFDHDPKDNSFEIAKNIEIFTKLYKELNTYYVDDVNPTQLMEIGINAMTKSLDPYTNFISEDRVEDYLSWSTGEYSGIGVMIKEFDNEFCVTRIYEEGSAKESGLKVGDIIMAISGKRLKGIKRSAVSKLIRGQTSTVVDFSVKRYGSAKEIVLPIKRVKIKVKNVPFYTMLDNNIGYIKLSDFTKKASNEVRHAYVDLKKQGAKRLILDLRGNPGGLLHEAVNICNIFLDKNLNVVNTKGKFSEWNKTYGTLNAPTDLDVPLVVLTNNRSASASEIVSGTIQDYDRGVLIGQRTFGKGLVQISHPLAYNSQIKVTCAKYYIPSGRCIQALDYSNKDQSGHAARIPDSLRRAFKTKGGRKVFDGAGLEPDIIIDDKGAVAITESLAEAGSFFKYANMYVAKHSTIPKAKNFSLSDAEYKAFVTWVKSQKVDYNSKTQKVLELLKKTAKKEQFSQVTNEINAVQAKITAQNVSSLTKHKSHVKLALEQRIAERYYDVKGALEVGFAHDKEIIKAKKVLQNPAEYKKILGK